ncbi:hypothetical protein CDAR_116191 [Caerostris darwini]|uniref:Uncharacterized protein n=1 Tax=Caerostris darwini TaxID=1538125 RepID=A0AAV4SIH0_9ARAC|nr:hypothetical protein CDAR_116191 [Caerostris darwini]
MNFVRKQYQVLVGKLKQESESFYYYSVATERSRFSLIYISVTDSMPRAILRSFSRLLYKPPYKSREHRTLLLDGIKCHLSLSSNSRSLKVSFTCSKSDEGKRKKNSLWDLSWFQLKLPVYPGFDFEVEELDGQN